MQSLTERRRFPSVPGTLFSLGILFLAGLAYGDLGVTGHGIPVPGQDGPSFLGGSQIQLQAAESSLATGQGPVHGVPLLCHPERAPATVQCGSTARLRGSSAIGTGPSTGGWSNLTAGLKTAPEPRTWASMTFDSHDGYVVLFGGSVYNSTSAFTGGVFTGGNVSADTWKFQNRIWTDLTRIAGDPPAPRMGAMMSDDPADGYVLLFGGAYSVLCSNGANNTTPSHPPGANCTLYPGPYFCSFYLNDSWAFRAGTWSRLHPETSPPGRSLGRMAYDPRDGYVLLFGGLNGQELTLTLGDTWTFSHGNWTDLTPKLRTTPAPRGLGGLAWDASDGYLLLFGGVNYISTPPWSQSLAWSHFLNDTWTFQGGNWTNITASLPIAPTPRWDFELAGGPRGGVLFFAGLSYSGNFVDTWLFENHQWWYLTPVLSGSPPGLSQGMATFIPGNNTTLLFGGAGGSQLRCVPSVCTNTQNYTWIFGPVAPNGLNWFPFPALTITVSPGSGWAPLNISINVTARGGQAPYNLTLSVGSIPPTGVYGAQDNFAGGVSCGYPGQNGPSCPGPAWNGSPVAVMRLRVPEEQVVYLLGSVVDAQGTPAVAVAIIPVAQVFQSIVVRPTQGPYTVPASLSFSVHAVGGVPTYRVAANFGDGTTGTTSMLGNSSLLSHTYAVPGSYYPTFTVSDSAGHAQSWSFSLTVSTATSLPALWAGSGVSGGLLIGIGVVALWQRRARERAEARGLFQVLSRTSNKSEQPFRPL